MQQPGHHNFKRTTTREIRRLCEKIAREFHPEKIILFGSHAYGRPEWDSEVDLLVIMPFKGTPHNQGVKIRTRIEAGIALICSSERDSRYRDAWKWETLSCATSWNLGESFMNPITFQVSDQVGILS